MNMFHQDYIAIEHLELQASVGVYAWEELVTQKILLDIKIFKKIDVQNDRIEETLDYAQIAEHLSHLVKQKHYQLIESIALDCATFLLRQFEVDAVEIIVTKPAAVQNAKTVSVRIFRNASSLDKKTE